MAVTINGTTGINTPGVVNTAGETIATTLAVTGAATSASLQVGGVATNLYPLVAGTAVASTSGTSIDFTSIPSWVKRITVMFSGVSTSGTSPQLIQLGDSGGIENTGYLGAASTSSGTGTNNANFTTGFGLTGIAAPSAAFIFHGSVTITALDPATNLWTCVGNLGYSSSAAVTQIGATKTLSGTLDRVRITTVNGTDTFDAGSINILYE